MLPATKNYLVSTLEMSGEKTELFVTCVSCYIDYGSHPTNVVMREPHSNQWDKFVVTNVSSAGFNRT